MRAQRLQVRGEDPVGGEQTLDAERRGEVGGRDQPTQVGTGQHEHAEHAVGAVDQCEALLRGELDRRDPGRGQRLGRRRDRMPSASRTSPSPISASAACASGARSPEQPSEPCSRTIGVIPLSINARVRGRRLGSDTRAARRQGREPEQHHRPDHLGLDLGAGRRGVRADQGALELGAKRGLDVPGRQGAEAGGHPVDGLIRLGQLIDLDTARVDRLERRVSQPDASPPRATARTSSAVTGPIPTTTSAG